MDGSFYISPEIVLLTIVVLIVCYLLSKIWQSQLEPNFRIKGKNLGFKNIRIVILNSFRCYQFPSLGIYRYGVTFTAALQYLPYFSLDKSR